MTAEVNSEQAAMWNGDSGHGWAASRDVIDVALKPFEDLLVRAALAKPRSRVLDVGCGTGGVTRAIAEAVGAPCVGVDISGPMISVAEKTANARFVQADAQVHAFEPESFDLVVSRFGVMFFDDPVAAFRNLRAAATPGAELRFVTWRDAEENPFMTTAQRAVADVFPDLPTRDPNEPGPFAFVDPDRTRGVLEEAGWSEIGIEKVDLTCSMPEAELEGYLRMIGPVSRALRDVDEQKRAEVIGRFLRAFDPFVHDAEVRFPTASWQVTALNPV